MSKFAASVLLLIKAERGCVLNYANRVSVSLKPAQVICASVEADVKPE